MSSGCRIKYLLQAAPAVKTIKQILFCLGIPGRLVAQHGKPPFAQHDIFLTVQGRCSEREHNQPIIVLTIEMTSVAILSAPASSSASE